MSTHRLPPEGESAAPDVPNELIERTPPDELFQDTRDYSAIGGPDNEPAYGRSRALAGEYPFNAQGGAYDLDEPAHLERGGIPTHHQVRKLT